MPSLRKEREEAVSTLTRDLKEIEGLIVAGYVGVKTPELNDLRDKLRPLHGRCAVVKNSLAKIALKNAGIDGGFSGFFEGQSALVIQKSDTLPTLKILVDFEKAHQNFKIRAGHLFGRLVPPAEIKAMASLPSKPVLLATLLARLNGPLQGLHSVLSGPVRQLVTALDQVGKKKQ